MKTLVLTFLLLAVGLSSCYSYKPEIPIVSQIPDNNKTYNVDYLFKHDGYRECIVSMIWEAMYISPIAVGMERLPAQTPHRQEWQ